MLDHNVHMSWVFGVMLQRGAFLTAPSSSFYFLCTLTSLRGALGGECITEKGPRDPHLWLLQYHPPCNEFWCYFLEVMRLSNCAILLFLLLAPFLVIRLALPLQLFLIPLQYFFGGGFKLWFKFFVNTFQMTPTTLCAYNVILCTLLLGSSNLGVLSKGHCLTK